MPDTSYTQLNIKSANAKNNNALFIGDQSHRLYVRLGEWMIEVNPNITLQTILTSSSTDSQIPSAKAVYTLSESVRTDLQSKIDALQGAYIYRGTLASGTESTSENLTSFILSEYGRTPLIGDVVSDSDGAEWYFDGTIWLDMGKPDENKLDKFPVSQASGKLVVTGTSGSISPSTSYLGSTTFNNTPNASTIPNERSVELFVESELSDTITFEEIIQ